MTTPKKVVARRFSRLHPVHSTKHVVDVQGGTALDTNELVALAIAVDDPARSTVTQVETGAHVSAIFLNIQVVPTSSGSIPNIYMYLFKSPGNNLAAVKGNAVGASDVKKFVLHQEMLMFQKISDTANPRTLFKGVIRIPGSYKRMGADDQIKVILYAPGVAFNWCIQCIYKEIR